jgi:hypothetical protein
VLDFVNPVGSSRRLNGAGGALKEASGAQGSAQDHRVRARPRDEDRVCAAEEPDSGNGPLAPLALFFACEVTVVVQGKWRTAVACRTEPETQFMGLLVISKGRPKLRSPQAIAAGTFSPLSTFLALSHSIGRPPDRCP